MPQLNEYPIEELSHLQDLLHQSDIKNSRQFKMFQIWSDRVLLAIADREFTDSQLPFRTPKEIEQDEEN